SDDDGGVGSLSTGPPKEKGAKLAVGSEAAGVGVGCAAAWLASGGPEGRGCSQATATATRTAATRKTPSRPARPCRARPRSPIPPTPLSWLRRKCARAALGNHHPVAPRARRGSGGQAPEDKEGEVVGGVGVGLEREHPLDDGAARFLRAAAAAGRDRLAEALQPEPRAVRRLR